MWRWVAGGLIVATVLSGCGLRRHSPPPLTEARPGASEVGTASWYGPGFHGNRTSSGEVYDQYDLTAAHQTLPLGTRVVVTNLDNGRAVEVRINDRGPFVKGRSIDLSYAAARTLGMIGPGTAPVRIEVLGPAAGVPRLLGVSATHLPTAVYTVQVGAFADRDNALRLKSTLARRFDGVYVATLSAKGGAYYRVRLGRFDRREQAVAFARTVAPLGVPAVIVEDEPAR